MKNVYKKINSLYDENKKGVVATLLKVFGSVPQNAGSKLLYDGENFLGTIGGGELEYLVQNKMVKLIQNRFLPFTEKFVLTEEGIGMECGGEAEVLFEPVGIWDKCHIFGAGHISQKLFPILSELGFSCVVYDCREEYKNLPFEVKIIDYNNIVNTVNISEDDYVIIITHSHNLDEKCLVQILKNFSPYYIGVIGSKTKSKEVKKNLKKMGFLEKIIEKISMPIGIPIPSKTPIEIAISISAELIKKRYEKIK